jgi:hypothetical protein
MIENETPVEEEGDPSVPTDLLELHVQLEQAKVTPEEFKEAYGDEASNKS